jgi:hypothetical protein
MKIGLLSEFKDPNPQDFECSEFMDELIELFDKVVPFTYEEAFAIKSDQFRALVFDSINVSEMVENLGHKRIKVEGKQVNHKQFDSKGKYLGTEPYDTIFETHEVNGEKLGLAEPVYAVKCWCTSTDEAHWLWIEEKYKDEPLEAIASTFRIHESLIPNIKELKRQGDILLVEMKDPKVKAEGNIVPLNAKQYFSLLTAQS